MAAKGSTSPARQKTAEEILSPTAIKFEANGKVYGILPMKERQLLIIGTTIADVVNVLGNFRGLWAESGRVDPAEMMAVLPGIIEVILPKSSELIAASLGESVEYVTDSFNVSERLEAISAILEAEDIELLVKNVQRLMAIIGRITQTMTIPKQIPLETDAS